MRRLRAAALSEVELAMDIINQAKAHLRAQGIDQWQTGYPDRDCLERDVRTGKGYFLEEDGIPLGYLCVDFDGEPAYDHLNGTWDDLNSATWAVLNPTSASGYIYPSLWLQEHYGKGISDLDNVVECDSHTTSVARLAAGQVDVMVSYGHIRIKNAPKWETELGGTAPMVEQTGVIGVTEGIYNDMIAYSKNSDTMADEDFRKALGESFIEIADTDEGREIISVFSQVGYTWGQDSDYDGERAAQELLKSLEG